MGLVKTVVTDSGATAEYHNVSSMCIDFRGQVFDFSVVSYLNKAARQAGKAPMRVRTYSLSGAGFPVMRDEPRVSAYAHVKRDAMWEGVQDD
jgi:hypothetical protein